MSTGTSIPSLIVTDAIVSVYRSVMLLPGWIGSFGTISPGILRVIKGLSFLILFIKIIRYYLKAQW